MSLTFYVVINAQPDSLKGIVKILHLLQEEAVLLLVPDRQNVGRIVWRLQTRHGFGYKQKSKDPENAKKKNELNLCLLR